MILKINELLIINKEMGDKKLERPFVYKTEEERKEARKRTLARCMRETPWYCSVCQREYTLGGKHMHLKTAKHSRNCREKPLIEL